MEIDTPPCHNGSMSKEAINNNSDLIRSLPLAKFLSLDLLVGITFGLGGLYLELVEDGKPMMAALPATANLVGVIVGLSLAAMAIHAAFLDFGYLREAATAGIDPVIPLRTAAWTVTLGVAASLMLIVRLALPEGAPEWLFAISGGVTSLLVGWSIASVPSNVTTLISAIRLRQSAATKGR